MSLRGASMLRACGSQASLRGQRGQLLPSPERTPPRSLFGLLSSPRNRPSFPPGEQFSNFVANLSPVRESRSSGRRRRPSVLGSGGGPAPGGFPRRGRVVPSHGGIQSRDRAGEGQPPPSPIQPARGGPAPRPLTVSAPPSGCPTPAGPASVPAAAYAGAPPLPPRPTPSGPVRLGSQGRQRRPDAGRWTSGRKVSSEERGGTGRDGAGRGRRGGRARRKGSGARGAPSRTGSRWGGRCRGRPQASNNNFVILKVPFCLGVGLTPLRGLSFKPNNPPTWVSSSPLRR